VQHGLTDHKLSGTYGCRKKLHALIIGFTVDIKLLFNTFLNGKTSKILCQKIQAAFKLIAYFFSFAIDSHSAHGYISKKLK